MDGLLDSLDALQEVFRARHSSRDKIFRLPVE
jgi:hypothetical protein